MKRQFARTLQRIAALTLGLVLTLSQGAQAATNTGTGDVAGVPADLVDSNVFTLLSSGALTLVKSAYLVSDGSVLASDSTLPAGTLVDFMIYTNNKSDLLIADVSIQDVLDPLFIYQGGIPGTIHIDNAVGECLLAACTALEEKDIYDAALLIAVKTDAVDADAAGRGVRGRMNACRSAEEPAQQREPRY